MSLLLSWQSKEDEKAMRHATAAFLHFCHFANVHFRNPTFFSVAALYHKTQHMIIVVTFPTFTLR